VRFDRILQLLDPFEFGLISSTLRRITPVPPSRIMALRYEPQCVQLCNKE
jgi:hypothetical protein